MHSFFGASSSRNDDIAYGAYGEDAKGDSDEDNDPEIVHFRPQVPRQPGAPAMAAMFLKGRDGLGLIGFPEHCVLMAQNAVNRHWEEDGIRKEIKVRDGVILRMRGWPWTGKNSDSIKGRRLLRSIMAELYHYGWKIVLATNLSDAATGKDTMVFRQTPPSQLGDGVRPMHWFTVVFSMRSRLRFIDAPDDVIRDLIPILPNMQEHEQHHRHVGVHDFELRGQPFRDGYMYLNDGALPASSSLVLFLATFLEDHNCSVYTSIRQKHSNGEADGAPDTWHVYRPLT